MLNIYYNKDLTLILGGIFMKKFIFIIVVISIIFTINTAYANWFKESSNQPKETTNVNGYTVTTFKLVTIKDIDMGASNKEDYYILIIKSPNGKTTEVLTNGVTTIKLQ